MTEELDYGELLALVLDHYGIDRHGHGSRKLSCPLPGHEDRAPSCNVDLTKGLWQCHGCGRGGGVYHLISEMEGCGHDVARQRAEAIAGGRLPAVRQSTGDGGTRLPQWARTLGGGAGQRGGGLPPWARR